MVIVLLRPLLLLFIVAVAIYFFFRKSKHILKQEKRKEALQEALDSIDDTLNLVKEAPDYNPEKLRKAREKINQLLKEGAKNDS
jgi:flagellar basal body-associated protein FliL